jgi:hypothetical protein
VMYAFLVVWQLEVLEGLFLFKQVQANINVQSCNIMEMVKEFYASCLALSHMAVGGNEVASVSFGIRFVPDFTILGVSSQQVTTVVSLITLVNTLMLFSDLNVSITNCDGNAIEPHCIELHSTCIKSY